MQPSLGSDRDYAIWMNPIQINDDMRNLAMEDVEESLGTGVVETQTDRAANIFLLYEQTEGASKGDGGKMEYTGKGLLDINIIKKMMEIEEALMNDPEY